jgi:hypothetical protein
MPSLYQTIAACVLATQIAEIHAIQLSATTATKQDPAEARAEFCDLVEGPKHDTCLGDLQAALDLCGSDYDCFEARFTNKYAKAFDVAGLAEFVADIA